MKIKRTATTWFWAFILTHVTLWTLGSALCRHNLPFDTLESITWGDQWQLTYSKHPPFSAWILSLSDSLHMDWMVYLTSQLAILVAFWAIFELGKRMLPPWQALAGVLLLEGVIYYNFISPKINPTTFMTPIWALLMLAVYRAVTEQRLGLWMITGILAGWSLLTKYQAPFIWIPLFIWTLSTPQGRASYKTMGPYVALLILGVAIAPHMIASAQVGFPELQYALHSSEGDFHASPITQGWMAHLQYPFMMLFEEIGAVMGLFLIALVFWKSPRRTSGLSQLNSNYLWIVGLGPLALTLSVSAFSGSYLYSKWATPYFILLGLLTIAWINPRINLHTWKRFISAVTVIGLTLWLARCVYLIAAPRVLNQAHPDAYFPGALLAQTVTELWEQQTGTRLGYIMGDRYLVANIHVYSKDHPIPVFEGTLTENTWLNTRDLMQRGGVIIWWTSPHNQTIPTELAKEFPTAKAIGVLAIPQNANTHPRLFNWVGVAELPPAMSFSNVYNPL